MGAVYFIATYDITDPGRYEREYVPRVVRAVASAGGEVVVASGRARALEGAPGGHTVVVRFPSQEAFQRWYDDAANAAIHELRLATTTNGTAVLATAFAS